MLTRRKDGWSHQLSSRTRDRTGLLGIIAAVLLGIVGVAVSACGSEPASGSQEQGQLVYSVRPGQRSEFAGLFLVNDDGRHRRRLAIAGSPESSYPLAPDWSPDGSRIAYVRAPSYRLGFDSPGSDNDIPGVLHVIEIDGGVERRLGIGRDPQWSPDGGALLVQAEGRPRGRRYPIQGLAVVPVDGERIRFLKGGALWAPGGAWSPDGTMIAFVRTRELDVYDDQSTLYVVRRDGTALRKITTSEIAGGAEGGPGVIQGLAWSPHGESILIDEKGSIAGDRAVRKIRVGTRADKVIAGPESFLAPDDYGASEVDDVAVSPDGQIAFSGQSHSTSPASWIKTINVEDGERKVLVEVNAEFEGISDLAWSPGGSKLAYILSRPSQDKSLDSDLYELYVVNSDGSERPRRVSKPLEQVGGFDWRPTQEGR